VGLEHGGKEGRKGKKGKLFSGYNTETRTLKGGEKKSKREEREGK